MIKQSTAWTVLIYGLVIMGLGYLGYYQSHSKASLGAGLGSGAFLILSSLILFKKNRAGLWLSLGTTVLLSAIFCYRYAVTQGTLPGILALISGAMLIYLLTQSGRWKK